MIITEKVEVEDKVLASGGFADVRRGTYMGHLVAVKALRVAEQDDFVTIRKVSSADIFPIRLERGLDRPSPAILQGGCSLGDSISSKRLEVCWGSRGYGERAIRHRVRMDGAWEHHGVH